MILRIPQKPFDLFCIRSNRYVRNDDEDQMLVFVDGSCRNNGNPDARAGWAVCVGPSSVLKGRLEPDTPQKNNRAELQSAIVALEFNWIVRGFSSIVIATDSLYVAQGYCEWFNGWEESDWKKTNGRPVANSDLWRVLDSKFRRLLKSQIQVLFWKIPRDYNLADKYARQAVVSAPHCRSDLSTQDDDRS